MGNPVGDTQAYAGSLGFPTMSADSVSNTVDDPGRDRTGGAGSSDQPDGNALQAGPQVSLTWRDNATNETGFVVERCTGAGCTNFAQIAAPGPRNNTGNVTYVDTTVTAGNTYLYRVAAVNAAGPSRYTYVTLATPCCARDSGGSYQFHGSGRQGQRQQLHGYADLGGHATNPDQLHDPARHQRHVHDRPDHLHGCRQPPETLTQTVTRNTTYYYRIRANNTVGGSSAWTNALPFPIRTGP